MPSAAPFRATIKTVPLIRERTYHLFFEIGVIIKAAIAVAETLAGIFLLAANPATVNGAILRLIGGGFLTPERQSFWAFIALSHGIVKLALVAGLLKHKLWSYPASAAVFTLLVAYQIYDLIFSASVLLALVTVFDIVVILLILHEYRRRRPAG